MFLTIIYKSHRINKQISRFEAVSPLRDDFTAEETAAEHPMIPQYSNRKKESAVILVKSILIKDTTREERIQIVQQSLWGSCGIDCEFCSGCDNRGGGRTESIYQPYIDGLKELREINAAYSAPFVRG